MTFAEFNDIRVKCTGIRVCLKENKISSMYAKHFSDVFLGLPRGRSRNPDYRAPPGIREGRYCSHACLGQACANPGKFALRADAGSPSWSLGGTSLDTTVTPATAGYALGCHSTTVCACFTTCAAGYSGGSLTLAAEGLEGLPVFIPGPISISLWYLSSELFSRSGPQPTDSQKVARISHC